jgi:hypothetical protein
MPRPDWLRVLNGKVPAWAVQRLEVSEGRPKIGYDMLRGALIGGAVGALVGAKWHKLPTGDHLDLGARRGLELGAVLGGTFGVAMSHERWTLAAFPSSTRP